MAKKHKSFPEKVHKTNFLPGPGSYQISPMEMIVGQIKSDAKAAGVDVEKIDREDNEDE